MPLAIIGLKKFLCFILVFLLGALATQQCNANDYSHLAKKKSWLRLIHYESSWAAEDKFTSAIHSPEFFVSPSGKTNPEDELRATLAAMLQPLTKNLNSHAKCRFPARRIWLTQHFPEYSHSLKEIDCPEFSAWISGEKIDSVSLVFASGYLGNPASYYGHLFLKFNSSNLSDSSYLTDQTANFGAIGTDQDDPASYILKGVFGGYDGGFSPIGFYFHNASYTERELRDLWEYKLSLTKNDVQYIVSHAWEVLGKRYTYYFFRANCAYRVAELIEIVEGVEIIPKMRPWTIPQAVLQTINAARYEGNALISSRIFHPSRRTRFYQRYQELGKSQRKILGEIVMQKGLLNSPQMQSLELHERGEVLDALLEYQQLTQERKDPLGSSLSPDYIATLSSRLSLPPDDVVKRFAHDGAGPETGKAPSWVQVGITYQPKTGLGQTLRIRPAYYDSLDVDSSHAKHGGLSMGDLMLEHRDQKVRILHLDVIAIDSMNPGITGLPGDKGIGWRLRAGWEQERVSCRNCLKARLQGDYGVGSRIGVSDVLGVIYFGGALQARSELDGLGFGRLGTSLQFRSSDRFGVRLSHEIRLPFETRFTSYSVTTAEVRYRLIDNVDLRMRWDRDSVSRISIAIGHYW